VQINQNDFVIETNSSKNFLLSEKNTITTTGLTEVLLKTQDLQEEIKETEYQTNLFEKISIGLEKIEENI
jgi:hypothetical protein